MSNIFFTSDEHYNHSNIIKFCNRPFSSVEEMQEKIIENNNSMVKPGDRVYHLGDMFWRTLTPEQAINISRRLTGQHYYIYGNHDELFNSKSVRDSFIWCKDTWNLKVSGYPNIWLSHYAHRVWNGSHKGAWHLYGHVHGQLPEDGSLSFDIGVDTQNFLPVSLEQVKAKMNKLSEGFIGKCFVCKCGNKFVPFHTRQTFCTKCGSEMELK